jgi:hypothetical protein
MDSNLRFRNRSVPISGQPVRLPSRLTASRPGTGSSNPSPSSGESANLRSRPSGLLRLSVPRAVVPILLEPLIAFDLSKLILRDGGALAVMRELAELAREIDVHTDLHKLLDEDPVVLVCERDTTVAMSTGFCIATIKPTKRLHRLLTTLRAKKADLESTRSRKLARLDRELDNSAIKTPAAPAARS